MKFLTRERIEACAFIEGRGAPCGRPSTGGHKARPYTVGASVLFLGIVRDHSHGKKVLYLEYEAYEEMADRMIQELVEHTFQCWMPENVKVFHRIGRVDLGEIAVAIEVRSAHRVEAYAASRYLIEEIKHRVPIWKKEFFADGTSEWSSCSHCEAAEGGRSNLHTEIASSPAIETVAGSSQ